MDIPTISREYTPDSCRNSRKPMRLPTDQELRPESPALEAEQFRVPNQKCKEPWFAWLNCRESPRTLIQDEKNTDVTSGTQNSLVYPKSNWDDANFPCICSINIPWSTSYRTSALTPFRKLQRLTETPVSSIEDHQCQYSNFRKFFCNPYCLRIRISPSLRLKR